MKLGVSSYSFDRMYKNGSLNQLDSIAKAEEMGFAAIEFSSVIPHDGSSLQDYAKRLGEEAERNGLAVSSYTIAADFLNGSGGHLDEEVERLKKEVEIAVFLGAKLMRHDATWGLPPESPKYAGFKSVLPILAEGCRRVTEYAQSKGVKTMVENHGYFCQESQRVEKLVNTVAHENFGLLVDIGNFLCADEDPAEAVGRVAPYAFHVHAKDFIFKSGDGVNPGEGFFPTRSGNYLRGTILGHGIVPVKQCLSRLKNGGYDGFVSIEFEGMEENIQALTIGLANLRKIIHML